MVADLQKEEGVESPLFATESAAVVADPEIPAPLSILPRRDVALFPAMRKKDYYLILGVSRTESPSGIRAAFRELANRYHPERIGPPGAHFFTRF
jgi:DnaJ-domain-containing protein 1